MGADANHRCTVLGVEYVVADMAAATAAVVERALSGQGGYASLAGVHGVVTAQSIQFPSLRRRWCSPCGGRSPKGFTGESSGMRSSSKTFTVTHSLPPVCLTRLTGDLFQSTQTYLMAIRWTS